jgi:hypothetical protein
MNRKELRQVLVAAALAFPLLVGDAGTALAQKADPAARQQAMELLKLTKAVDLGRLLVGHSAEMFGQYLSKSNPGKVPEIRSALGELLLPEMEKRLPSLYDEMAGLYAAQFTLAELKQLVAFYKSPLGVKTVEKIPMLAQQSMTLGQEWGSKVSQEVLQANAAKLRERGLNL